MHTPINHTHYTSIIHETTRKFNLSETIFNVLVQNYTTYRHVKMDPL
jgi:hypothetical protein